MNTRLFSGHKVSARARPRGEVRLWQVFRHEYVKVRDNGEFLGATKWSNYEPGAATLLRGQEFRLIAQCHLQNRTRASVRVYLERGKHSAYFRALA